MLFFWMIELLNILETFFKWGSEVSITDDGSHGRNKSEDSEEDLQIWMKLKKKRECRGRGRTGEWKVWYYEPTKELWTQRKVNLFMNGKKSSPYKEHRKDSIDIYLVFNAVYPQRKNKITIVIIINTIVYSLIWVRGLKSRCPSHIFFCIGKQRDLQADFIDM